MGRHDGDRSTSTAGAFGRNSSATVESPSSSLRVIQRRTHDHALDVVAGAIAAHVGPAEFDGRSVGGGGDAFDEQRRRASSAAEQASLAGGQEDRLEELACLRDAGPVAIGQQIV